MPSPGDEFALEPKAVAEGTISSPPPATVPVRRKLRREREFPEIDFDCVFMVVASVIVVTC
jgi:hypothetical protein